MAQSVLEQEIARKLMRLRANMVAHDRGVLLGFLLSLAPIFPVPLLGLLIGVFNAIAHRGGRINGFDYVMVRRGLILGAINSVISVVLVILVIRLVGSSDMDALKNIATYVPRQIFELIRMVLGFFGLQGPAPETTSV